MQINWYSSGIFDFPQLIRVYTYANKDTCKTLRCVNKYFNEVGMHPTLAQLTNRQIRLLEQIRKLDKIKFQEHVDKYRRDTGRYSYVIPYNYVVSSGTGTGKTLLGLYTIKTWHDEGHTVIITTGPTQFSIWQDEYKKWKDRYNLPEIKILHGEYLKNKQLPEIEMGDVLLVSNAIHESHGPNTFSSKLLRLLQTNAMMISRGITDEIDVMPTAMRKIALENEEFYSIVMNATRPLTYGIGSKEGHIDEQLPDKPNMDVHIQRLKFNDLENYLTNNKGKQNLIVYMHESGVYVNNNNTVPLRDIGFLQNITKIVSKDSNKKKLEILRKFKDREINDLLVPLNFIAKGHNIYPDTLFILGSWDMMASKLFYQVLGRIYRYASPYTNVNTHILCSVYEMINSNYRRYHLNYLSLVKMYQLSEQNIEHCLKAMESPFSSQILYYYVYVYDNYYIAQRQLLQRIKNTSGTTQKVHILLYEYYEWFIQNFIEIDPRAFEIKKRVLQIKEEDIGDGTNKITNDMYQKSNIDLYISNDTYIIHFDSKPMKLIDFNKYNVKEI